ncbi:MAG: nucleotidyltransferase domain-containing protein [Planctomycetes bacterium]|nr:nucleotidyltransferase domain-containing protein [Planctomycetota bacterium]
MRSAVSGPVSGAVPTWQRLRPPVTNALLASITRRIVRAFKPVRVILFGSYAYGTPRPESDVDLFVVMSSRESMSRRMIRVARVAYTPFLPMDVLVFTPSEVRDRIRDGDPFVAEVLSRGKVLYTRGSMRRVDREGRG